VKKNKIIGLSLYAILALQVGVYAQSENQNSTNSLESVDVISSEEKEESYTIEAMSTSTKLNLSIRDTPQSVTVMTSSQLEDLGLTTYDKLLTHVTGVTVSRSDERLHSTARGFIIDYFKIDGIPVYEDYNDLALDLSLYERIEIVRGANGLTTGAGNPGISINLVRKRANSKELAGDVTFGFDSEGTKSITADVSDALNEDGSVRGRLIVKNEDGDSFMNGYKKETNIFSAVVDTDISDKTQLSTGFSYEKSNKSGVRWGGLPAFYADGSKTNFDRSFIVSKDWTALDTEITTVFADLKHNLDNNAVLNFSYSYSKKKQEESLFYFGGAVSNTTNPYYLWAADIEQDTNNIDLSINVPFDLGGLTHEIVVGASSNITDVKKYNGAFSVSSANFYNNNVSAPDRSNLPVYYNPYKIKQKAIYLSSKILLSEELKIISGARLSSYESTQKKGAIQPVKISQEITPYLGMVYDVSKETSFYSSYTSIFKPQTKLGEDGSTIKAISGNSLEVGVKSEFLDKNLITSVSLFRTKQNNLAEDTGRIVNGVSLYREVDGVTSEGIEFDVTGNVSDNLTLNFGIANFEAKSADDTKYNTKSARTTANLSTRYKMNEFTFGAGADYQSKIYTEDATHGTITQDAYVLFNAMASYKISDSLKAQVNIENLFDKTYYEGIGSNSMVYGSPRTFSATLKYSF